MADIVLINPRPLGGGLNEATIEPPLGLGYIASFLRQHGFLCKITDANVLSLSSLETVSSVTEKTVLVGISVNSFTVAAAATIADLVRTRSSATIILGGAYPSAKPERALELIAADAVIIGEGEYPLLALMESLARGEDPYRANIAGLIPRRQPAGVDLRQHERICNLDDLPFPAYDLLPPLAKYRTRARKRPVAALITSRGCAYDCTFCSKDVFQRKVRFRSAENVLAEIDELHGKYGVKQLDILDDNFLQNEQRLAMILEGIIRRDYGMAINLQTGIRTEMLNQEMLKLLKRAGVFKLAFGIESGDPELLEWHKKSLDLSRVESVISMAKRLGFIVYGFFIIGLLGETEQGFQKTLALARKLDLDVANFCMALPFPGTDLYQMVARKGHFLHDTTGNIEAGFYGGQVFYEYDGSTAQEILNRYQRAYKEFYSFKRQVRMLLNMRSAHEFLWYGNAVLSVAKGMIRRNEH